MPISKTALDIVLLPSEPWRSWIIEANAALLKLAPEQFVNFRSGVCEPHLSLAMATVNDTQIPNLIGDFIGAASSFKSIEIDRDNLALTTRSELHNSVWLEIMETPKNLERMHSYFVSMMDAQKVNKSSVQDFAYADKVRESDCEYVDNYSEWFGLEKFSPHLTLGKGNLSTFPHMPDKKLIFNEIALFQLGPHCSCVELIHSISLSY